MKICSGDVVNRINRVMILDEMNIPVGLVQWVDLESGKMGILEKQEDQGYHLVVKDYAKIIIVPKGE